MSFYKILLLLAVVLGAVLRFGALDFGDGLMAAHPDERATIDAIAATRASDASYFHVAYGGGYVYPLYGFVRLVEQVVDVGAIESLPPTDAGGHSYGEYVVARGWSALASTAVVLLTGMLAWRTGGPVAGGIAALLVAASPVAVRDAHFAKADSVSSLAAVLLLLVLTGRSDRRQWAAAVGLATGFVVSVKYQVGLVPAALFALAGRGAAQPVGRRLLVAGGTAALVTVALNTFWLWTPGFSWLMFEMLVRSQYAYVRFPWFAGYSPSPLAYHGTVSLVRTLGWPAAIVALPSMLVALSKRGPLRLIAIALLGQWTLLVFNPLTLTRNFLPSVPGLAVIVACVVDDGIRAILSERARVPATVLLALILVAYPLHDAVRLVTLLGRDDTRVLARRWLEDNAASGSTLVVYGTPPGAPPYGFPIDDSGRWKIVSRTPRGHVPKTGGPVFEVWHRSPLPYSSGPGPEAEADARVVAVFAPNSRDDANPLFEPFDAFYLPIGGFDGVERAGPRIEIRLAESARAP